MITINRTQEYSYIQVFITRVQKKIRNYKTSVVRQGEILSYPILDSRWRTRRLNLNHVYQQDNMAVSVIYNKHKEEVKNM